METAIPEFILDTVRSLPPLPAAIQRLLELAKNPDVDFQQVADVIETDQTLTARTLRAANSAIYGVTRRIQTVRQAIVLLGRDAVTGLAVGASILGMQGSMNRRWPVDPDAYWRHTIGVALLARFLSVELKIGDPEEAFVAGLLHDIGKTIMLDHFGDMYGQVLLAAQYGTSPLHVLEREVFETDHAVVGQALCMHWNIPAALTRAVAEHHDDVDPAPNSLADIVRDANELVKLFPFSDGGNRFVQLRSSRLFPHNLVKPDSFRAQVVNLPEHVSEAETVFGNKAPTEVRTEKQPTVRPLVHLQVSLAEERDMLVWMLLAMGYEPVLLSGSMGSNGEKKDTAPLAGFITDLPLSPDRQIAYRNHGVPVLDYTAWRASREHLIPAGHFNVFQLREWISAGLQQKGGGERPECGTTYEPGRGSRPEHRVERFQAAFR